MKKFSKRKDTRPDSRPKIQGKEGVVEEALPSLLFRVRMGSGEEVLAHLSGRLRIHHIRVLPGDRVSIELGPDGRRGRIVRRL